jgi:hypothetical protein
LRENTKFADGQADRGQKSPVLVEHSWRIAGIYLLNSGLFDFIAVFLCFTVIWMERILNDAQTAALGLHFASRAVDVSWIDTRIGALERGRGSVETTVPIRR